jgi:tRNA 2-thiocytidine biosynthesis protein TtcA
MRSSHDPGGITPADHGSEAEKRRRKLSSTMASTIAAHRLIEEGDRILVAVSGGKDSYTLLDLLLRAERKAPVRFELIAFHLDQAQPGYDGGPLREWLERSGLRFEIARQDTYSTVLADAKKRGGATYCRLCSRLRRGALYGAAGRLGCNKIALGHHRDDALQTLLLNLFFSGRLQAMPAIYTTNDEKLRVIRPLIECAENDIALHAAEAGYPILPCNLCGSQEDLKRVEVARLLERLEKQNPNLRQVMLAALKNVRPSHLLDVEVAEAWAEAAPRYEPRR